MDFLPLVTFFLVQYCISHLMKLESRYSLISEFGNVKYEHTMGSNYRPPGYEVYESTASTEHMNNSYKTSGECSTFSNVLNTHRGIEKEVSKAAENRIII